MAGKLVPSKVKAFLASMKKEPLQAPEEEDVLESKEDEEKEDKSPNERYKKGAKSIRKAFGD